MANQKDEVFKQTLKELFTEEKKKIANAIIGDEEALQYIVDKIYNIHLNAYMSTEARTNDFIKSLTNTEKAAIGYILAAIDKSTLKGVISINALVNKSQISRPVYNNILDKMTKYNVAYIVNKGVKGTQITLVDKAIFKANFIEE
jgi:GTP-sensing pleiotropic transcriptional regulator CodY